MRKKLVLYTDGPEPKQRYLEELNAFFEGEILIEAYSMQEGRMQHTHADLALITLSSLATIAKKYLPDDVTITQIKRTFKKGSLDPLMALPENTQVMLVNNASLSASDTISLLYEMGYMHIDFVPVFPGMKNIPKLKTAVTPAQVQFVPDHVEQIIDVGWRVIDISTLMSIVTKLQIQSPYIDKKLKQYMQDIIPISYGFHHLYNNTNQIQNELRVVLDVIDDGVMILSSDNSILHCNTTLKEILALEEADPPSGAKSFFRLPDDFLEHLIGLEYTDNRLIDCPQIHKSLIVSKRPIHDDADIFADMYVIKDRSNLQKLEQDMRYEAKRMGHVAKYDFDDIIGISQTILHCKEIAKKMSRIDAPVLITGESGTGKEMFAQSIHNNSQRRNSPFLGINCATLSTNLLESELFGYEEGAFTGAVKGGKKGLFEMADGGSLFLDEVGELPLNTQVKLLRVLQEKEIMRIGGTRIIPVDVRILSATNQDLKILAAQKLFRHDLYYRLNVLNLKLPPLRNRIDDLPLLIRDIAKVHSVPEKSISPELMKILMEASWEGNIRELKNVIDHMYYLGGTRLSPFDLPPDFLGQHAEKAPVNDLEEAHVPAQVQAPHLYGLSAAEIEIACFILDQLHLKPAGRRSLFQAALKSGYDTSEYRVRKIMKHLEIHKRIEQSQGINGYQIVEKHMP